MHIHVLAELLVLMKGFSQNGHAYLSPEISSYKLFCEISPISPEMTFHHLLQHGGSIRIKTAIDEGRHIVSATACIKFLKTFVVSFLQK
jgi:hypothetical protein